MEIATTKQGERENWSGIKAKDAFMDTGKLWNFQEKRVINLHKKAV